MPYYRFKFDRPHHVERLIITYIGFCEFVHFSFTNSLKLDFGA
jgi:hypothetical protein